MRLKIGDRVNVYDWRNFETRGGAKGTVCAIKDGRWVGVDLDCGMLTDWFMLGQIRRLRPKRHNLAGSKK